MCAYWFQQNVNSNLDSGTKSGISRTPDIFEIPGLSKVVYIQHKIIQYKEEGGSSVNGIYVHFVVC